MGDAASTLWKRVAKAGTFSATAAFALALVLPAGGRAQQIPQLPTGAGGISSTPDQNTNTFDCTDPLLATTPQCTAQNVEDSNQVDRSLVPGGMPLPSATGLPGSGLGPRGVAPNYSDYESQRRERNERSPFLPERIPPEPLTEFQKFAASATGQILPVYGASLFSTVPSTFAPLDMAPVPPEYVIGPGDELRVRLWGEVNFQATVHVDRAGEVYIPVSQVGPIHVAGLHYSELQDHLHDAIARVYRNFSLLVDIGQIRAIQVYVSGAARRPGVFTVSSLSTLVDALFASGGPSVQGSLRAIEVRRGTEIVTRFDLYELLLHGDKSKDIRLAAGDLIFIPPVGPQAAVTGSVRNPGIYELKGGETLADLIRDAGEVSTVASQARVSIERIASRGAAGEGAAVDRERHAMEVGFDDAGLRTAVADGDVVRIFSMVPKYNQTVTLRGNVANPGRFAWHPGMRMRDLIPDRESLITRNYWWKRAQLGLPGPEFEPGSGLGSMRQPSENSPVPLNQVPTYMDQFGNVCADPSAIPPGTQPGQGAAPSAPSAGDPNVACSYGGVPLGQQTAGQQPQGNQGGPEAGGAVPEVSSTLAAQLATSSSRVPRGTVRLNVSPRVPEIYWDYAVIERLDPETLKTRLIPFDLGKLVNQHDDAQNLELQAGDVISILSEADVRIPLAEQTKVVRLEGEFVHSGVYTVQPGETLQQLVVRAGGLTPSAYLYGSEFTRESTRVIQQARINEYVQSLDMRIQRSTLALAGAPSTGGLEASTTAAQASSRELLSRLRQMRATGRIVLAFKPESAGTGNLPDVTLEDGDRFIVPSVPANINVVGAVNDQNSFLFKHGGSVDSYLKMAGGFTKDADRKRSFVIRADGEVVGYTSVNRLLRNNFEDLPLNPGDTLVVPEKTFKPSSLLGFLDWSQVFSQLAVGVAAVSVLR